MTKFGSLLVVIIGLTAKSAFGDLPVMPYPFVAASPLGNFYFMMLPHKSESSSSEKRDIELDWEGIAYELNYDGSSKEVWRTNGWYSFEVFLSYDGNYLVAMGPLSMGLEPSKEDVAVTFYSKGKLLKQYSTLDLVKDRSKVLRSMSHYRWLARDVEHLDRIIKGTGLSEDAALRLSGDNTFRLKTCDGIVYFFDITTGAIKQKKP